MPAGRGGAAHMNTIRILHAADLHLDSPFEGLPAGKAAIRRQEQRTLLAALAVLTAVCNTLLCRVMASSWALIVSTLLCAFLGVFFVDLGEEAAHEQ